MADEDRGELGVYVRELRQGRGLSQVQLARLLGVSDGLIGQIEVGNRGMPHERCLALAEALELDTKEQTKLMRRAGHSVTKGSVSLADRVQQLTEGLEALRDDQKSLRGDLGKVADAVARLDNALSAKTRRRG